MTMNVSLLIAVYTGMELILKKPYPIHHLLLEVERRVVNREGHRTDHLVHFEQTKRVYQFVLSDVPPLIEVGRRTSTWPTITFQRF